jgi:hypothetical protein
MITDVKSIDTITISIIKLLKLCVQCDIKNGQFPESRYEGISTFVDIIDILHDDQKISDETWQKYTNLINGKLFETIYDNIKDLHDIEILFKQPNVR